ncbi:MAG: DUF1501 domain-containing protein [Planctomycetia bacterium]|nr:DUF1501 domain-containing protein [Planctomycetia bacterium]
MNNDTQSQSSRRHFLASQAMGIGGVALAWLVEQERALAEPAKPALVRPTFDVAPKAPRHAPQATAMISLFMQGGPSHVDLCDPKPELQKRHLEKYSGELKFDNPPEASAKLFASPWKFRKHGRCGMELSELLPGLAEVVDDITLIRSMRTGVNNHAAGMRALNSGGIQPGRPSLGSWCAYGLGTENRELPAYLVLTDPEGVPVDGINNWANGYLPAIYQGTVIRPQEPRILNLDPPPHLAGVPQEKFLSYLDRLNREHFAERPGEHDLAARIAGYELAARMQVAAKEALDLSQESAAMHKLYGLDQPETRDFGSRCLIARRLVERGVRFVQICTGNQHWDNHNAIVKRLPAVCKRVDVPSAALVKDLKSRGLLETTLVQWGGEMGRLPVIQNEKNIGRDHNTYGFSMWMAGGGVRGGHVHGATDDFGHHAVQDPVSHNEYLATLMHLLGLDPQKLNFTRPSGPNSLIDTPTARVVKEILTKPEWVA